MKQGLQIRNSLFHGVLTLDRVSNLEYMHICASQGTYNNVLCITYTYAHVMIYYITAIYMLYVLMLTLGLCNHKVNSTCLEHVRVIACYGIQPHGTHCRDMILVRLRHEGHDIGETES